MHEKVHINEKLRARYDRIAGQWNSEAYAGTRRDDLIPQIIDAAKVPEVGLILEAMCGTGSLTKELIVQYPCCIFHVLDFSENMLNEISGPIIKTPASITETPYTDKQFDRIFIRSALYDIPKDTQLEVIKEVKRILKDDGKIILQTYHTNEDTNTILNDIVNTKDKLSGFYDDDSATAPYPRYFATDTELRNWFDQAGLSETLITNFEGYIPYTKTKEVIETNRDTWLGYVSTIPENLKRKVTNQKDEAVASIIFPGKIYLLTKV